MTPAMVMALEHDLRRDRESTPLATRLRVVAEKPRAMAGPNGRIMTKDEIDALSE